MPHPVFFQDYFRGKKVLVTGHTGFKGAWLCLWLKELGAQVTGYALKPYTQPNFFEQCGLESKIQSHIADIRNQTALENILNDTQPEVVFHLAAQPIVRRSYKDPVETFSVNVMGTAHVLEAVRRCGNSVRVCQIITSDKCYDNRENLHAYSEEDPLGGRDPYSASKGAAELVVAAYRQSFFPPEKIREHGVSLSSVRAGNVLGGGDWGEDRIMPDSVRALANDRPVSVRNPTSIRPWQYILDVLSGYLQLAQEQTSGSVIYAGGWNFGPSTDAPSWTVAELVEKVIEHWGKGSWIHTQPENSSSNSEAVLLKLDTAKAAQILNWFPVYDFNETLEQTVLWYLEASQKKTFDAWAFSRNQIHAYTQKACEKGAAWTSPQKALR